MFSPEVRTVPQGTTARELSIYLDHVGLWDNWDGKISFWGSEDDWKELDLALDAWRMAKTVN